jgi:hypothetical protein
VTTVQSYSGPPLPPPERVLIYEFAFAPDDVHLDSSVRERLLRSVGNGSESERQMAVAVKVAKAVTETLVLDIRSLGLAAAEAKADSPVTARTLLVRGQILSTDEGNRTRRTLIGLGAGQSVVEADAQVLYAGGAAEPQLVESFTADSNSGRAPGMAETMGAGAAAGRLATSAAAGGGLHLLSESHRAGVDEDGERLAHQVARNLAAFFVRQGWIPADAAR